MREAVGPDIDICLDFHGRSFSPADAIRLAKAIEPYHPYFFEEPAFTENPDALVQVNISGDESKSGFQCSEVESALEQIMECQHIKVKGLMAMAGLDSDIPSARREFESMRRLQDRLQAKLGDQITLSELSMGMSRDYEMAIEEGATIVRVGSEIFRE